MHKDDSIQPAESQSWVIEPEQVGMRLDRYITGKYTDISRTHVQQLIEEGAILVNDRAGKAGYGLRLEDEVRVLQTMRAPAPLNLKPLEVELEVIFEDEDLLVINKPIGMVVHPAAGHRDDTVVNALLARYPELQAGEDDQRPGIVHRLDRDTTGLLIIAKNPKTQAALIEQIKGHEIEKRYLALVEGIVSLEKGTIDAPIGRDTRHRQQMTITNIQSREARTHFRVQERFAKHTLLLVQLETGRTHQIRVHLKAINHPVFGDPMYGSGRQLAGVELKRQFLHAYQLRFTHPTTGKEITLEAPLPQDLQDILTFLREKPGEESTDQW